MEGQTTAVWNGESSGWLCALQKLNYVVLSNVEKGAKVRLLKDVHGFFLPGQMAALVGDTESFRLDLIMEQARLQTSVWRASLPLATVRSNILN